MPDESYKAQLAEEGRARRRFLERVLAELLAVEKAPEGRSIYAIEGGSVHGAGICVDSQALAPECAWLHIRLRLDVPRFFVTGQWHVNALVLHCHVGGDIKLRAFGRSYMRPLEAQRKGGTPADVTPWVGYNYAAIHKAVMNYSVKAVAAQVEYNAMHAEKRQRALTLFAAIKQTGRHVENLHQLVVHLRPPEKMRTVILSSEGMFRNVGRITPQNAARVLDALELLATALAEE